MRDDTDNSNAQMTSLRLAALLDVSAIRFLQAHATTLHVAHGACHNVRWQAESSAAQTLKEGNTLLALGHRESLLLLAHPTVDC